MTDSRNADASPPRRPHSRGRRPLRAALATLAAAGAAYAIHLGDTALRVGTGFSARVTCSLAFVSSMDAQRAFDEYVAFMLGPAHALVRFEVDRSERAVTARALHRSARAVFRDGTGCVLVADADESRLRALAIERDAAPDGDALPVAPLPPEARRELELALDEAFAEPSDAPPFRNTKAVVVLHRGALAAERYADDVDATTPLLSWSMAKSVTATLAGIAIGEGRLALMEPLAPPEWSGAGDPRGVITLDQLLRMSSGLAFDEHYGAINDVSVMLFARPSAAAYAASRPLAHAPDRVWSYSSGTSNIVARALADSFGGDVEAFVAWTRRALFDRIGMRSALIELDASGGYLGSSFVFATARDWARFGQLYLDRGVVRGQRVLPEDFVDYVRTPTPAAPRGQYGAHFWLNAGSEAAPEDRAWPSLPRDVFAARGMSGQYIVVVPGSELVVARLGLAQAEGDELHGIERLVARAMRAVSSATTAVR